ncbi:MAG: ATP-binding protein [Nitriliruptoraceae bacterium]
MTGSGVPPIAVIVAGPEGGSRDALVGELSDGLSDVPTVVHVDTDALRAATAVPTTEDVGLVALLDDGTSVDRRVAALGTDARARAACTILVTARAAHDDLDAALDADRLAAIVADPWTPSKLAAHARSQLARWLRTRDPDDPRLDQLDRDGVHAERPTSALLHDLELDAPTLSERLVAALDRALGRRPRLELPAGTRLTHQGVAVDGVFVILSGSVALDRSSEVGELRLHHASTGPVVGLLSLTQQRQAFFTARTTTDVRLVHLSLEQLDQALAAEPEVSAAMAAAAARALGARLRRAEQLQVEKVKLNRELDRERTQLAEALSHLEAARLELVESARMATLGELAAGVAHELNNPVAALERAASFVTSDLSRLLAAHPRGRLLAQTLDAARERPPTGTADQRDRARQLTDALGDARVARRLAGAGIEALPAAWSSRVTDDAEALEELATAAELGAAVRNLDLGTRRVTELVTSLRSYARPSDSPVPGVDVRTTIDDTLHLVAHRLEGLEITRDDAPDLPTITGYPGPLGQVWTNLLLNAADALDGRGHVEIATRRDGDEVVVTITDDGPGIGPEVLPRLFEPRFTTKQGQVRYGLGLGLAIAKRVVDSHGGTIAITSEPGRTVATVRLPIE